MKDRSQNKKANLINYEEVYNEQVFLLVFSFQKYTSSKYSFWYPVYFNFSKQSAKPSFEITRYIITFLIMLTFQWQFKNQKLQGVKFRL